MVDEPPILRYEEMGRRYDGRWVLIRDYEVDPDTNEIVRGRVIADAIYRDVSDAAIRALPKPFDVAMDCFREPGDGTVLML